MTMTSDITTAGRAARWVLILFVLAAAVRVGWVTGRYANADRSETLTYPDEDAYWLSARSLAAGEGLRDEFGFRATYMPAYPAFLAVFAGAEPPLLWARIVQAILAAWVAPATFLVARRWDRWTATDPSRSGLCVPVLAGLAAAVDPFLIFFTGLLLTEALFAAAIMSAWIFVMAIAETLAARRWIARALIAGLLLCLCIMLRPSAAVLVAVIAVWIAVGRGSRTCRLTTSAILVLTVLAGLLPWAARNRNVIGEWRWLSTRGGVSLYDGLQPNATGGSDLAHTKTMPDVQGLSETQWDRYFHDQALSTARQNPKRVALLAWHKFLRTWSLTPNVEAYRQGTAAWISAAWMALLLATAVLGLWSRRTSLVAWTTLLLPVIVFTLLHMVFVGSVRYRVPTMPLVMILSAAGVCRCLWRSRVPKQIASPADVVS